MLTAVDQSTNIQFCQTPRKTDIKNGKIFIFGVAFHYNSQLKENNFCDLKFSLQNSKISHALMLSTIYLCIESFVPLRLYVHPNQIYFPLNFKIVQNISIKHQLHQIYVIRNENSNVSLNVQRNVTICINLLFVYRCLFNNNLKIIAVPISSFTKKKKK